jgi:hypothetical protein
MTEEFEALVSLLTSAGIDDREQFTIVERRALDLMLDSLKARNLRLLSVGERSASGRCPVKNEHAKRAQANEMTK